MFSYVIERSSPSGVLLLKGVVVGFAFFRRGEEGGLRGRSYLMSKKHFSHLSLFPPLSTASTISFPLPKFCNMGITTSKIFDQLSRWSSAEAVIERRRRRGSFIEGG